MFGSFGHYHCALNLNPAAKVLTPAAMARHSRRLQERIRLALRCSPLLSQVCPATPVAGLGTLTAVNRLVLHSHSLQAQHSHCVRGCPCCELMTYSCAVAHLLPCLHFTAHRHRLNTKLRRKQVEPHFRQTFFGEPKISKSGIGKRERNQYCVLVISRTPASSPHNALHIPLG